MIQCRAEDSSGRYNCEMPLGGYMANYRLYCLDGRGKISAAEWLEAEDNAAAVVAARKLGKSVSCELWLRDRMIERIEPEAIETPRSTSSN